MFIIGRSRVFTPGSRNVTWLLWAVGAASIVWSLLAAESARSDTGSGGLLFLHQRLLDTELGRFVSADLADLTGNIPQNRYAYGDNSPGTKSDVQGRSAAEEEIPPEIARVVRFFRLLPPDKANEYARDPARGGQLMHLVELEERVSVVEGLQSSMRGLELEQIRLESEYRQESMLGTVESRQELLASIAAVKGRSAEVKKTLFTSRAEMRSVFSLVQDSHHLLQSESILAPLDWATRDGFGKGGDVRSELAAFEKVGPGGAPPGSLNYVEDAALYGTDLPSVGISAADETMALKGYRFGLGTLTTIGVIGAAGAGAYLASATSAQAGGVDYQTPNADCYINGCPVPGSGRPRYW